MKKRTELNNVITQENLNFALENVPQSTNYNPDNLFFDENEREKMAREQIKKKAQQLKEDIVTSTEKRIKKLGESQAKKELEFLKKNFSLNQLPPNTTVFQFKTTIQCLENRILELAK